MHALIAILLALCISAANARPWKSADGTRTIEGEFVERASNRLTLRLPNGELTTFGIDKLHPDELKWLDLNHPTTPQPTLPGVFDTLNFGDTHAQVLAKLKASKFVTSDTPENLIGRTGLNGIFRLSQKVANLDAYLFFEWSETETLTEIQIRTAGLPAADYQSKLNPSWLEFSSLLTTLHGPPIQTGPQINPNSIPQGTILSSHVWKIEAGGNALLGIGREKDQFQIVVRIAEAQATPPAAPTAPAFDF